MIGTVKIKNHIFVIRTELIQLKRFISRYLGVNDVMQYLIDTTSKVREQKQKRKVTWDSSTDSVKRGVEIFRSRILKRIDDMEEKLMLEVNALRNRIDLKYL
jgi:hypothetical protein